MNFLSRLGPFFQTRKWLHQEAARWAAQFYSGDSQETARRVLVIVAAYLKVSFPQITTETRFVEDLRADDLQVAEVFLALEREFGLDFTKVEAMRL